MRKKKSYGNEIFTLCYVILDEVNLGAVQHMDFIKAILELYGEDLAQVVAFHW